MPDSSATPDDNYLGRCGRGRTEERSDEHEHREQPEAPLRSSGGSASLVGIAVLADTGKGNVAHHGLLDASAQPDPRLRSVEWAGGPARTCPYAKATRCTSAIVAPPSTVLPTRRRLIGPFGQCGGIARIVGRAITLSAGISGPVRDPLASPAYGLSCGRSCCAGCADGRRFGDSAAVAQNPPHGTGVFASHHLPTLRVAFRPLVDALWTRSRQSWSLDRKISDTHPPWGDGDDRSPNEIINDRT